MLVLFSTYKVLLSCFPGPPPSGFISLFICITHVICHLKSPLLIFLSYSFPTQLSSYVPPSALSHSPWTIPASIYQSIHTILASIHLSKALFPSILVSFIFLSSPPSFFFTILCVCVFFCLTILFPLHSFISALLALMSVAMARSIQDGVFVLSTERKMNVAAMHRSLPTVWGCGCASSVFGVVKCAWLWLVMPSFEWP